ncbi:MAG: D-tyrosyl-tRNA(Tyr) deacylase, partial [Clostridia bacterium]|nr:D-tyrosyl-tRNA(Tyr) deacylase [Clostridia bacterium]
MKAVIQRVTRASVTVDGEVTGEIGKGFLVLLGVMQGDTEEEMKLLAKKVAEIRIFEDENEKMNLSLDKVDGEVLVVSQFTLCADVSHGRRPSFINSAPPAVANELYESFCEELRSLGVKKVAQGIFAADMAVELINDGPVTIIMNTDEWKKG